MTDCEGYPARGGGLMSGDRVRLETERAATVRQIEALTADLAGIIEAASSVATDDEHDPEGTTIAYERANAAGLLGAAQTRLADLDAALRRLDEGAYGVCERCGRPIGAGRLEARPSARTCIECARA
jgi:DnaK suppressor protein